MTIIAAPPRRRRPDFTLTMINIVFLLLLFFLTTGSLTNRNEAQADIPITSKLPLERLPRPLLLIGSDGGLYLDGRQATRATLVEEARRALELTGNSGARLNLLAERGMAARAFLDIAALLGEGGVQLQIVTLHEALPAAAGSP